MLRAGRVRLLPVAVAHFPAVARASLLCFEWPAIRPGLVQTPHARLPLHSGTHNAPWPASRGPGGGLTPWWRACPGWSPPAAGSPPSPACGRAPCAGARTRVSAPTRASALCCIAQRAKRARGASPQAGWAAGRPAQAAAAPQQRFRGWWRLERCGSACAGLQQQLAPKRILHRRHPQSRRRRPGAPLRRPPRPARLRRTPPTTNALSAAASTQKSSLPGPTWV
jgi:hypothetical protein